MSRYDYMYLVPRDEYHFLTLNSQEDTKSAHSQEKSSSSSSKKGKKKRFSASKQDRETEQEERKEHVLPTSLDQQPPPDIRFATREVLPPPPSFSTDPPPSYDVPATPPSVSPPIRASLPPAANQQQARKRQRKNVTQPTVEARKEILTPQAQEVIRRREEKVSQSKKKPELHAFVKNRLQELQGARHPSNVGKRRQKNDIVEAEKYARAQKKQYAKALTRKVRQERQKTQESTLPPPTPMEVLPSVVKSRRRKSRFSDPMDIDTRGAKPRLAARAVLAPKKTLLQQWREGRYRPEKQALIPAKDSWEIIYPQKSSSDSTRQLKRTRQDEDSSEQDESSKQSKGSWVDLGKRKYQFDTWRPSGIYKRPAIDEDERKKSSIKRTHEPLTVEEEEEESEIPVKSRPVDFKMWN